MCSVQLTGSKRRGLTGYNVVTVCSSLEGHLLLAGLKEIDEAPPPPSLLYTGMADGFCNHSPSINLIVMSMGLKDSLYIICTLILLYNVLGNVHNQVTQIISMRHLLIRIFYNANYLRHQQCLL